ncbi:WRKY transcription factor [Salvia divinorum]|uniref:WRKY transcription factor n=1 Tax=Salvia divinorum TaxID=28513 RepID=A0ABD1H3W4_SALDI
MSGEGDKPDPDFAAASAWDLRHHPADNSFFYATDDYKESTILSEFGWNIPPDSGGASNRHCDFADFPPIEPVLAPSRADDRVAPDAIASRMVEASPSNPSVSSSSSDDPQEKSPSAAAANPPPESAGKTKKKGQKRIRQPRFAFVTKSEVDHLEDGYRWRKYGQKAVKNSPFPRSYYRCTNSKCMVKKRIERSFEDPSVVITTYEGQHSHYSVGYPRGGMVTQEAAFPTYLTPSSNNSPHLPYHPRLPHPPPSPLQPAAGSSGGGEPRAPPGEGLLGDIVPPRMRNNGS